MRIKSLKFYLFLFSHSMFISYLISLYFSQFYHTFFCFFAFYIQFAISILGFFLLFLVTHLLLLFSVYLRCAPFLLEKKNCLCVKTNLISQNKKKTKNLHKTPSFIIRNWILFDINIIYYFFCVRFL